MTSRTATRLVSTAAMLILALAGYGCAGRSGVRHLTDASFAATRDGGGLVLVDAYADWCQPCRQLAPEVETLAAQFAGRLTVGKLNVDQCPAAAQQYGVRVRPTLLLFRDGKLVSSGTGFVDAGKLAEWVGRHLD